MFIRKIDFAHSRHFQKIAFSKFNSFCNNLFRKRISYLKIRANEFRLQQFLPKIACENSAKKFSRKTKNHAFKFPHAFKLSQIFFKKSTQLNFVSQIHAKTFRSKNDAMFFANFSFAKFKFSATRSQLKECAFKSAQTNSAKKFCKEIRAKKLFTELHSKIRVYNSSLPICANEFRKRTVPPCISVFKIREADFRTKRFVQKSARTIFARFQAFGKSFREAITALTRPYSFASSAESQ